MHLWDRSPQPHVGDAPHPSPLAVFSLLWDREGSIADPASLLSHNASWLCPHPQPSLFLPSTGADCGCWGHVDPTGGPVREHRLHSAPAGSSGCHKEQPYLYCLHHRWGTWSHFDAFFSLHGACLLSTSAEPWPGRMLLKTLSFLFFPSPFPRPCQKIPTTEVIMEASAQIGGPCGPTKGTK